MAINDNTAALEALLNAVHELPNQIKIDTTLTQSGQAADAKTVGDALANLGGGGGAQIETGSYTGTGTYGADNPNTLTFSFEPNVIFVTKDVIDGRDGGFAWIRGQLDAKVDPSSSNTTYVAKLTWDGNTVRWYVTNGAHMQLNSSGGTYRYVAIG